MYDVRLLIVEILAMTPLGRRVKVGICEVVFKLIIR